MRRTSERCGPAARRAAALTLGLTCAAAVAATGPLPQAWRHWQYSCAVQLPTSASPRLVSVVIPAGAFAHAQAGLGDLRVADDLGREVPYLIYARHGSHRTQMLSTRTLETSFSPGQYTQVILDLGGQAPFHNAVEAETRETDFIAWVQVAVSDTARDWRILLERAPIFRFRKQGLEGEQALRYSETNARYVRLRFLDGDRPFVLQRAVVTHNVIEEPERVAVPAALRRDPAAKPQESWWHTEPGAAVLPIAEVRFEVDQPEFRRAVRVRTSNDGENWELRGNGEIYRFRQDGTLHESLRVGFSEASAWRLWRVEVVNGSDPPLEGARPALFATPRHVVFRQEPGRSYRLLYGNTEAKPPRYEMARLVSASAIGQAVTAGLGAEEVNTAYADPRPWTERHPVVLWAALGIAVVLLGLSALRALRGPA